MVHVPQVADEQTGVQFSQYLLGFDGSGIHAERAGHLFHVAAVFAEAVFACAAGTDQFADELTVFDQAKVVTDPAIAGERRA